MLVGSCAIFISSANGFEYFGGGLYRGGDSYSDESYCGGESYSDDSLCGESCCGGGLHRDGDSYCGGGFVANSPNIVH